MTDLITWSPRHGSTGFDRFKLPEGRIAYKRSDAVEYDAVRLATTQDLCWELFYEYIQEYLANPYAYQYDDGVITLYLYGGGALEIDGVEVAKDDRLLLKNQTNSAHNGIYEVTAVPNDPEGSVYYKLERTSDADTIEDFVDGMFVSVSDGDVNGGKEFILKNSPNQTQAMNTTRFMYYEVQDNTVFGGHGIDQLFKGGDLYTDEEDDSESLHWPLGRLGDKPTLAKINSMTHWNQLVAAIKLHQKMYAWTAENSQYLNEQVYYVQPNNDYRLTLNYQEPGAAVGNDGPNILGRAFGGEQIWKDPDNAVQEITLLESLGVYSIGASPEQRGGTFGTTNYVSANGSKLQFDCQNTPSSPTHVQFIYGANNGVTAKVQTVNGNTITLENEVPNNIMQYDSFRELTFNDYPVTPRYIEEYRKILSLHNFLTMHKASRYVIERVYQADGVDDIEKETIAYNTGITPYNYISDRVNPPPNNNEQQYIGMRCMPEEAPSGYDQRRRRMIWSTCNWPIWNGIFDVNDVTKVELLGKLFFSGVPDDDPYADMWDIFSGSGVRVFMCNGDESEIDTGAFDSDDVDCGGFAIDPYVPTWIWKTEVPLADWKANAAANYHTSFLLAQSREYYNWDYYRRSGYDFFVPMIGCALRLTF